MGAKEKVLLPCPLLHLQIPTRQESASNSSLGQEEAHYGHFARLQNRNVVPSRAKQQRRKGHLEILLKKRVHDFGKERKTEY